MKRLPASPPKLMLHFFRWFCHPKLVDHIEGDLVEEYQQRVREKGRRRADLKFTIDVLLLFRKGIIRPIEGYKQLNTFGMYKSYVKIGWRNLLKNKAFSAINILGLSVGIACCVLLTLFVHDELSYDTQFKDADRIYRLTTKQQYFNGNVANLQRSSPPIGPALLREFPEVESQARVVKDLSATEQLVKHQEKFFYEKKCYKVDSTFFELFPYPFLEGNPKTALKHPWSVVLSEKLARKFFGDQPALDQLITLNTDTTAFKVTGVIKSTKRKSHLDADLFISGLEDELAPITTWATGNFVFTYLKLKEGTDVPQLVSKFEGIMKRNGEEENRGMGRKKILGLQPLRDVHLHSKHFDNDIELGTSGSLVYVYAASAIGFLILALAAINFINLTTAKASLRANEIGVRKTIGASRLNIFFQFIGESMGISFIAMLMAFLLVYLALPYFNRYAGKEFVMDMENLPFILTALFLFTLVTGFVAGIYPSLILSSLQPVKVMKNNHLRWSSSTRLRKGMIAFQFTISIILISSILIIRDQIHFMESKPLGFDASKKVMLNLRTAEAIAHYPQLKREIKSMAGVEEVTASSNSPATPPVNDWNFYPASKTDKDVVAHYIVKVDENYFKMMRIPLMAGHDFSFPADAEEISGTAARKVIVNQASLKGFGIPMDQAIGSRIRDAQNNGFFEIIGVVEDFHQFSMHKPITPMIFYANDKSIDFHQAIIAWHSDSEVPLEKLQQAWHNIIPDTPFEGRMLTDTLLAQYESDKRTSEIVFYFSLLAVAISCLGLYGLSIFVAERKTKEIGIRKVLGASAGSIVSLLSKEFLIILLISFLVAAPISYFIAKEWLSSFAYRTELSLVFFLLAGIMNLLAAMVAVAFESVKATFANPVKSLKSE